MAINFEKKASKQKTEVPTSSLADIVFILLIFFMVSTVLRNVKLKVRVNYPKANNIEKIEQKRKLAYIYVGPKRIAKNKYGETQIEIDNAIVDVSDISEIMSDKLAAEPKLIVSIRMDEDTKTGILIDIQQQLRDSGALRINYSTKPETTASP
jgi:biopolymer transport protein ExbD